MGSVELQFTTKGLAANQGFRLRYQVQEADYGGLLTRSSGSVTSTGFADNSMINKSIECSW